MSRKKWAGERGAKRATYSVSAGRPAASSELGRRREAGPGAPSAAAAGVGGSAVGACGGLPK